MLWLCCVTSGKWLTHSGPAVLFCNNMEVIYPTFRIVGGEVKERMHLKQEAQGLYSPQTILEKKVHSLLKINFFFFWFGISFTL